MPITVRPATLADLPTLLRFEQGVIAAERPMDPTIQDGPIHYYDLNTMLTSPDVHGTYLDHSSRLSLFPSTSTSIASLT